MLLRATQIRLRTGTLTSSLLGGCWEWCGQQPSALQELHHLMESLSSGLLHFRNSQYPVTGHLGSLPKLNDLVNFRGLGRLLRSLSWLHKTYLLYLPDLIDWLIDWFLAALGIPCYAQAFSSCGRWGLLSGWHAQASHCFGFPCCRAQALGMQAQ